MEAPQDQAVAQPEGEKKPKKFKRPHTYRISWPVVFIILLIGVGAYGFWSYGQSTKLQSQLSAKTEELNNKQKELDEIKADRDKAADSLIQASANNEYLVISEWGVKFKPGTDLKDVFYFSVTDANQDSVFPTTRTLMSSAFAAQAAAGRRGEADASTKYGSCGPGSIGILQRGKKDTAIYSTTFSQVQGAVKAGDYYYIVNGPQAACTEDKTTADLSVKQVAALKEAIKTLIPAN